VVLVPWHPEAPPLVVSAELVKPVEAAIPEFGAAGSCGGGNAVAKVGSVPDLDQPSPTSIGTFAILACLST
jgi:hypothetical protein